MHHRVPFGFAILATLILLASGANRDLYSKKEIKAIDKFRPVVQKFLTMDYQNTNGYLLLWIRGNSFDLKAAAEELEKHYNWRKENKIDSILDKSETIPSDLPYNADGVDKEGRPIAFQPFGKWNIRKYVLAAHQGVIIRQYQRLYETAIQKAFLTAEQTGKDIDQIYVLTDIEGYTLRNHGCLGCVPVTLNFARSFTSGVIPFAKNITLVNVPRAFQPVLNLARAIVTKLPVTDYDSNKQVWQQKLFYDISPDQLPISLRKTR